ncbi:hypothetical protein ACFOZ5_10605 [Marinobacter lacisalsi]|uniref:Uncharacterized protein n=1 Tax=Marinobacter lacisalsi TaxID=475979 RepID=A0ABV8QIB0_9GAMM
MNLNTRLSVVSGVVASLMLASAGAQASCEMPNVGHMYMSFVKQITLEDSPAEAFKAARTELRELAEAQKVENFAITSSDMSIGAGGYGSRGLSLHISIGAQMAPNPDVIDVVFRETQPESFSYSESVCVDYEAEQESGESATETQAS